MKVEVDEELIMGMAEEFQTTPEHMAEGLLVLMDQMPPVRAKGGSLEDAVRELANSASAGRAAGAMIDDIVEGRSYLIYGCQHDMGKETMLFTIEPVESDHIDSMCVQFGRDAFTSAKFSLEADEDEHGQYKDEFDDVIDSCEDWLYGDLLSANGNAMKGEIYCAFEDVFGSATISEFEEIVRRVKRLHDMKRSMS